MLYTKEDVKKEVLQYFSNNIGGFDSSYVKLIVTDVNGEQLAKYKEERSIKLNSRLIITYTIFGFTLFILYFTMKSNVMKRMQELTVYRLMGTSKRSIYAAYILEVIMVTSVTVLPTVLIFSFIIKFISGVPSLEAHVVYPWSAVFMLLSFLYVINIAVGLIPVFNTLKFPPAQLAAKR